MATLLEGPWPYQREQPDLVVLGVEPGHAPSPLPPVRIFLGTEEGQYRAERVFVWSVLQVRDPARVYEIHLMKNVAGFDRRGWRTGFTCYRFAIPDFAGRTGKAIYNDVDQIYLADPALLFDLPLDGHGYLAIDARDTSVMLIDCERMLPWWNRAAASAHGAKGPLTRKPAEEPGLWGELDGHWNARDLEYVEGRTKCLHYTALHQQPWNPFPEAYSYHQNPLAYIWHDLERGADAAGWEMFTPRGARAPASRPSWARTDRPRPCTAGSASVGRQRAACCARRVPAACWSPASTARSMPRWAPPSSRPLVTISPARAGTCPRSASTPCWPPESSSASPVRTRTGSCASCSPRPTARWCCASASSHEEGVGSEGWWRRRVEAIAAHHPTVSWELDAVRRLPTGLADGRGDAGPARHAARKPIGLGAHRRGRGSRPPGAPGRRGAGRALRREAAGVRATRGPARPGLRAPRPAASMPRGRRRWRHPGRTS